MHCLLKIVSAGYKQTKKEMRTTTAILVLVPWLLSFNVCATLEVQRNYVEGMLAM